MTWRLLYQNLDSTAGTIAQETILIPGGTSTYLRADGTFAAPGGSGTVTSVDLAAPAEFAVSGNPVTTSGTLAFGYIGPTAVAHGGTGAATLGSNAMCQPCVFARCSMTRRRHG